MRTVGCALAVIVVACLPACEDGAPAASTRFNLTRPRYYLVGPRGTRTLDVPPKTLLPKFGVSVVEERTLGNERVGRTRQGRVIPMRDLRPADPSPFAGSPVTDGRIDFGFAVTDDARVFREPHRGAAPALDRVPRLGRVALAERGGPAGWWRVRVAAGAGWMSADALRVPSVSPRPRDVGHGERWIDVELATQTLVAYEGDRPVFATLIAGGTGAPGTRFATPPGVHRVGAKLLAATMDNLEHTGVVPYSYEDVPHTQYIGRVALHGVFWHDRFGHPMSHGCINLSVADAERLFAFTEPRLPAGVDQIARGGGTVVRVR